VQQVGVKILYN